MTKRVAIVYDIPGWCWHRRAASLQRYAPAGYTVDTYSLATWRWRYTLRYDGVLMMPWAYANPSYARECHAMVASGGLMYRYEPRSAFLPARLASRSKNIHTATATLPGYRGIIAINPATVEFCRSINPRTHFLTPGVDTSIFQPTRPIATTGPLRIGWCGKSFDDPRQWTSKGYHEVLLPLMERLKGSNIEWVINRRSSVDAFSEPEMVDWYNSIDLFLVTSCSEGTPSTLLEAMACGRPAISTDVGIVSAVASAANAWQWDRTIQVLPAYEHRAGASDVVTHFERTLRVYLAKQHDLPLCGEIANRTMRESFNWTDLAPKWLEVNCS